MTEDRYPRPVRKIEVAPGTRVLPVEMTKVPALGVFEWRHRSDGSYVPVTRVTEAWMRVTEAEELPLGLSSEVIMRLIRGGFVDGAQPGPSSTVVNVVSLLEHIETTREDPDFWTAQRKERYRNGL